MSTNIIRNTAMLIKSFKFAQSHMQQDGLVALCANTLVIVMMVGTLLFEAISEQLR